MAKCARAKQASLKGERIFGAPVRHWATGESESIEELHQVNYWLSTWNHRERCTVLRQVLRHLSTEQRQFLTLTLYHMHMSDVLTSARYAYPDCKFIAVHLPQRSGRELKEMAQYRAEYNAWFKSIPKTCKDTVEGKNAGERLTPFQTMKRRERLEGALSTRPPHPHFEETVYLQNEIDVEEHHKLYAASHSEDEKLSLELRWRTSHITPDTLMEERAVQVLVPDTYGTGLPGVDRRSLVHFTDRKLKDMRRAELVASCDSKLQDMTISQGSTEQQLLPSLRVKRPRKQKMTTMSVLSPRAPPLQSPSSSAGQQTSLSPGETSDTHRTAREFPAAALGDMQHGSSRALHHRGSAPLQPAMSLAASCPTKQSEADEDGRGDMDTEAAELGERDCSGEYEDLQVWRPLTMRTAWTSLKVPRQQSRHAAHGSASAGSSRALSVKHCVTPVRDTYSSNTRTHPRLDTDELSSASPPKHKQTSKTATRTEKQSSSSKSPHRGQVAEARLPPNGRELIHKFIAEWKVGVQDSVLFLILTQLDPREMYFLACSLVIYTYRDVVSLLPASVAVRILTHLSPDELRTASQVCRRWHRLVFSAHVWERKYRELSASTGVRLPYQQCRNPNWLNLTLRVERIVHHWSKPLIQYTRMRVHQAKILGFNVDEERNLIATACHDGSIAVVDVSSCFKWTVLHRFPQPQKHVSCWCVSLFGMQLVVAGYSDGCIRYWSWTTKEIVKTVRLERAGTIYCLKMKQERMAVGCKNRCAYVFDVRSPNKPLHTLDGHKGEVYAVEFNEPATLLYTGSRDSNIREWQVSSGQCLRSLKFDRPVLGLSYDQEVLSVCSGGSAYLLDCSGRRWKKSTPFQGHFRRIEDVSFIKGPHPLGQSVLVTSGKDSMLTIHNCSRASEPLKQLFTHRYASVVAVRATATGIFALAGSRLYMWRFDGPAAFSYGKVPSTAAGHESCDDASPDIGHE